MPERTHHRLQTDRKEAGEIGNENNPDRAVDRNPDDRDRRGEDQDQRHGENDARQRVRDFGKRRKHRRQPAFRAHEIIARQHSHHQETKRRRQRERDGIGERRSGNRLLEQDLAIGVQRCGRRCQRHAIGRRQRACNQCRQRHDEGDENRQPQHQFADQTPVSKPEHRHLPREPDDAIVAPAQNPFLDR
ncbi:hypothetical protein D3C73_1124040 [compost metagenome]